MWITGFLVAFLFAEAACAKVSEQRLQWQDLPKNLIGQTIAVIQTDSRKVSGRLVRIEPDGLVLERRKGSLSIPRAFANRLEIRSRPRVRGQIIGTAVGAAPGIVLTWVALILKKNEGGANSDAIVSGAAGVAAAGAILGYFAGRASDTDKIVIQILAN